MADLLPDARVLILANPRSIKSSIEEIIEFDNVNVSLSTQSVGTATITIPNPQDKFSRRTARVKDTIDYLRQVINLDLIKEISDNNQRFTNLVRQNDAPALENLKALELQFLTKNSTLLGMMTRIWIDFRGRDERYYAGFSGLISSVEDSMVVSGDVSLTLGCSALTRYLELTPIILTSSIKPTPTHASGSEKQQRRALLTGRSKLLNNQVLSSIYDGQSNDAIISDIVRRVNLSLTREGAEESLGQAEIEAQNLDFSLQNKIWQVPESGGPFFKTYAGLVPVLESNVRQFDDFTTDAERRAVYLQAPHLLIHRDIQRATTIYQKVIRSVFNLFQNNTQSAMSIIKHVARTTWADFFQDGAGNIIYQPQLVDQLPGLSASELLEADQGRVELKNGVPTVDIEDFHIFHGPSYILGDEGLLSWRFKEDESNFVTQLVAPSGFDFNLTDGNFAPEKFHGFASVDFSEEVRFGVRHVELPKLILGTLKELEIVDAYAAAALRRKNAEIRSGSMVYNMRPDLQVGRTVYIPEREKLFYLVGTSNSFSKSQKFQTTTLGVSYGHDPGVPIGDPWIEVARLRNEEKKVATAPATSSAETLPKTKQTQRVSSAGSGRFAPQLTP